MGYNLILYGVKDASIADNRALVAKVFEALDETKPQSVRYLVLELETGEFVHLVGQDKDKFRSYRARCLQGVQRRSRRAALRATQQIGGKNRRQLSYADGCR